MVAAVLEHDPFFVRQPGIPGREGLTVLHKCTADIRMFAYGVTANVVDEYCQLSHTSSLNCLSRFCDAIIARFGPTYMRRATQDEVRMLYQINVARGLPGMLGSIDCFHRVWKNCPMAWKWKGQQGKSEKPTLILEAVASQDNWIWHSFFGVSDKHNNLTIVARLPVFDELMKGDAPSINFEGNNNRYNMGYYLTDKFYPVRPTYVKNIKGPITHKQVK